MDVNEHRFCCYSVLHSHSSVFNNEHNSYPKRIVKRSEPEAYGYTLLLSINSISRAMIFFLIYRVINTERGHSGREYMVVGFTTAYAISGNYH